MNSTAKNLMIILGILTITFAGYYFLVQQSPVAFRTAESDRQLQAMLVRTEAFVGHRQMLDRIALDASFMQSNVFANLRSFSPEPQEYQFGRANPFVSTSAQAQIETAAIGPASSDQE